MSTGWLCHLFTLLAAIGAGPAVADTPWSLAPLVRPAVPPGESHPIDAFIRARLAEKGIAPAPPADPRSLLRRLHYDLTGLPPTIDDVEAFVAEVAVKSTDRPTSDHLKGPRAWREEHPTSRCILVCRAPRARRTEDGIEILRWRDFVRRLWLHELRSA
jgi:hypothetical protein